MISPISLVDSYKKEVVEFSPEHTVKPGMLKIYGCGPTVYGYQHIGNMRAIWLPDTITKVAKMAGWQVEWISNITDAGHLVDDGDDGEDKIEKGAKRDKKTVEEIVDFYTNDFKKQCQSLHFDLPTGKFNPKASEYAKEQMILALTLVKKNLAYFLKDGIYLDYLAVKNKFEIEKENVSEQLIEILKTAKKAEKGQDSSFTGRDLKRANKKHANDFALWKFVEENALQKWRFNEVPETEELIVDALQKLDPEDYDIPNRPGCPGWHSECVCMISQISGKQRFSQIQNSKTDLHTQTYEIDIHTGGEDHIDIHHKNEILQSEALDFKLSKAWVHNKFVMVDGGKMSKSLGNIYMVSGHKKDTGFESIEEHGFNPLAYRLMLMEHHYTQQMDFTWKKLQQSHSRLDNLKKDVAAIRSFAYHKPECVTGKKDLNEKQKQVLLNYLLDNLNVPKFIEKFQEMVLETLGEIHKNQILNAKNLATIEFWESTFLQLGLTPQIPAEIEEKANKRAEVKAVKNWEAADTLRDDLKKDGWNLNDYPWGWGLWS